MPAAFLSTWSTGRTRSQVRLDTMRPVSTMWDAIAGVSGTGYHAVTAMGAHVRKTVHTPLTAAHSVGVTYINIIRHGMLLCAHSLLGVGRA